MNVNTAERSGSKYQAVKKIQHAETEILELMSSKIIISRGDSAHLLHLEILSLLHKHQNKLDIEFLKHFWANLYCIIDMDQFMHQLTR